MFLRGKRIILGISGSIAAYKSILLSRELVKAGAEVQVIMTRAAADFVTPLTLATLSGRPVLTDMVKDPFSGQWNNHVELALWADLMIIAPASSNTLSKMVSGQSDNLLLITFMSAKCQVFFAPAMDLDMYQHGSNADNLRQLQDYGHHLIPAEKGSLASGLEGEGRMAEPEHIIAQINNFLKSQMPLRGVKVLVTAGPTYELIDPVRFIGNFSSGKMGVAIAEAFAERGADVMLVCGPSNIKTDHPLIERINVMSALEMYEACQKYHADRQIVVMSAAVADYRPENISDQKIKKEAEDRMRIDLVRNPDILSWMGEHKPKDQILVGFALETENAESNARKKLEAKHLDLIVLNTLEDEGAGFGHDTNKVSFVEKENKSVSFELKSKSEVARDLVDHLVKKLT